MAIWGDFQGLTGVAGGGRGVKNSENWGDVIYGWSLNEVFLRFLKNTKLFKMHF